MKLRQVVLTIASIILADQALKIFIKTHYMIGQGTHILGKYFQLLFIENEGMAWGWQLGGNGGKMLLTLFRLAAVIFGTWYLGRIVKQRYSRGFIICAALIYAGALGNLIDSMFYGLIFEHSDGQISRLFPPHGYASFLHGNVVDMLYFPLIESRFPQWFPFVGGENFTFFSPIFNIADASISIGVIALLLFNKRFSEQRKHDESPSQETIPEQPVM